jgi:putative Holliday junction resolvase
MKYLGLDIGEKKIGVAIGDDEVKLALELLTLEKDRFYLDKIKALISQEKPDKLIVGLPISLSGQELAQAKFVKKIVREIRSQIKIDIEFQDERLSTIEAEKKLKSQGLKEAEIKKRIDQASAAVILQDYLDKSQITNNK